MKDIDFDELDKAVNSLMTNVPKTDTPKDRPEKTLDLTASLGKTPSSALPDAAGVGATSDSVSPTPAPSQPTQSITPKSPASPPATRRGGRFMDVVHPSSDMKGAQTPEAPVRVSRQGISVSPRPGATIPEDRSVASTAPDPAPVTETPVQGIAAPPAVTEKTAPVSEWPDPLELSGFKHEPESEAPTEKPDASSPSPVAGTTGETTPEPMPTPDEPKQEAEKEQSPLTSPFLPDAKVEKRPLGSGMPAADEPDRTPLAGSETTKTINDPEAQLPATPQKTEEPLPEELQGDLMAVEADTHMGVPKTDETHPLKEAPDLSEPEEKLLPEKTSPAPQAKTEPAEIKETPTGPTSIPQQYREEPSTGDKNNGAIYDTDAYHKPLAHPAKKKSGWLWVVWIIIILVVGAGGGALLYFLGLV